MRYLLILLPLLLLRPAAAEPLPIDGIVTRADGTPVAGAAVGAPSVGWLPEARESVAALQTVTDGQGRFSLPPYDFRSPGAELWITAFAEGLAAASLRATPAGRELRFVLRPQTSLPVRVTDTTGAPVAGVRLQLSSGYAQRQPGLDISDPVVLGPSLSSRTIPPTDAQGRTIIPHLPRGGSVGVLARDARWVQRLEKPSQGYVTLDDAPVSREHALVVQPAATLSGQLVTEGGRALAGYTVWPTCGQLQVEAVRTGTNGEFRVEGLTPGAYDLRVMGPPPADAVLPEHVQVSLAVGEQRAGFRVVCPSGSLITGRLLFADSGKPVAGVQVMLRQPMGCVPRHSGRTDAEGRFRIRALPGNYLAGFQSPPGYDPEQAPYPADDRLLRLVAENGRDVVWGDIRVVVPPARTVQGKVLMPDGAPAAGATIYYGREGWWEQRLEMVPHVKTDGAGVFTIRNLPSRGIYLLRAAQGVLLSAADVRLDLAQRPQPLSLQLRRRPLATLVGRVTDETGTPVQGALVNVEAIYPEAMADPPYPRTDAQGGFEITVWPGAEFRVFAAARGYGLGRSAVVTARARVNPLTRAIVLRRADRTLLIEAVDEAGQPVEDAVVQLEGPPDFPMVSGYSPTTNALGQARMQKVVEGEYRVKAYRRDGTLSGEGTARADRRAHRVVLRRTHPPQ